MPMHPRTITVNLWSLQGRVGVGLPPIGPPALMGVPAFLQQTRSQFIYTNPVINPVQPRFLYIDRRTDAEVDVNGVMAGYVECPAGSGTYYVITDVQDVDRGGPDEERRIVMSPQLFPHPLP